MNFIQKLFLPFSFCFCFLCFADEQYVEIPARTIPCSQCEGSGQVLFLCPSCNGSGMNPSWNDNDFTRATQSPHCRTCGGGAPMKLVCPHCENGTIHLSNKCSTEEAQYIPLWNYTDSVEDFFFNGNAVILCKDRRLTIKDHKILQCRSGNTQLQNLKFTSVTYGNNNCIASTSGILGMVDYSASCELNFDGQRLSTVKNTYSHEPRMQMWMQGSATPSRVQVYPATYTDSHSFRADRPYVIKPDYIKCCHEEYFFQHGILVKKTFCGRETTYKYLKFDDHNNWIERDVFHGDNKEPFRQTRTIEYSQP